MASKGQKFRSYSAELKQIILKEYFDGAETEAGSPSITQQDQKTGTFNDSCLWAFF